MKPSDRLKILRLLCGMTQEELALRANVSRLSIARWESGKGTPTMRLAGRLSGFLSVGPDQILDNSPSTTIKSGLWTPCLSGSFVHRSNVKKAIQALLPDLLREIGITHAFHSLGYDEKGVFLFGKVDPDGNDVLFLSFVVHTKDELFVTIGEAIRSSNVCDLVVNSDALGDFDSLVEWVVNEYAPAQQFKARCDFKPAEFSQDVLNKFAQDSVLPLLEQIAQSRGFSLSSGGGWCRVLPGDERFMVKYSLYLNSGNGASQPTFGYDSLLLDVSFDSITIYGEDIKVVFPSGRTDLAIQALENENLDSGADPRLRRNFDGTHELLACAGGILVCSLCDVGTSIITDSGQMLDHLATRFDVVLNELNEIDKKVAKAIADKNLPQIEFVLAERFGLYNNFGNKAD